MTDPDQKPDVLSLVDDATAARVAVGAAARPHLRLQLHPAPGLLAAAPRADVVILDLHLVNLRQPDAAQAPPSTPPWMPGTASASTPRRSAASCWPRASQPAPPQFVVNLAETRTAFLAVARRFVAPPSVTGLIEALAPWAGHGVEQAPTRGAGRAGPWAHVELEPDVVPVGA